MITKTETSLTIHNGDETIRIEAWGKGIRVRVVPCGEIPDLKWALDEDVPVSDVTVYDDHVDNGGMRCTLENGALQFVRMADDTVVLAEKTYPWALHKRGRTLHPLSGNSFSAEIVFESYEDEHLHGMGQYRDAVYDLKGASLELSPRNSQISVPFLLSSRGYGFLWNDPSIGRATFATNGTTWSTRSTRCVDMWVTIGDTPSQILQNYAQVIGRPSPLPDDLLGLWQCKLRYRTQQEVLDVAHEYAKRGIKPDVIVIDFFHWDYQGDWDFDRKYWPDPKAMVDELNDMGIRVMVSVWPTVDERSKNYRAFRDNGFLIRTDRGQDLTMDFFGKMRFFDATGPEARKFGYGLLKSSYGSYGIDLFWLDEAEPEYSVYDYDHYRQYIGSTLETGNFYPRCHAQMVYDGQRADGKESPLSLIRCAWVGSCKLGALVWSGDIESTFREMRVQLINGLNMGIAGIPWWISDTGGFYNGNIEDPVFKELLVRWYQWAVYMPILRMHGDRQPNMGSLEKDTDHGGGFCSSGAGNELWSYGEDVYTILKKYLDVRESLKPYISETAAETVRTGLPMMRAMFLEFPEDEGCYGLCDQYMFGSRYLVAPVTDHGARQRMVYLPKGRWLSSDGTVIQSSGRNYSVPSPLDLIPVFERLRED